MLCEQRGPILASDQALIDRFNEVSMKFAEELTDDEMNEAIAEQGELQEKIDAGELGRKSGKGFYVWEKGKPKRKDSDTSHYALEEITESLMQPYFDECEAALADGINGCALWKGPLGQILS